MKYFDAFSGYGGFSLAIQNVIPSAECVGFSEVDKYAEQIYNKNFNHKNYGDIKKIDWNTVPEFDLLTGGSPCQDFSIAGKRAGIEGERSSLIREYIRALEEKKPSYFIWENVKGVMSSRRGFDFANIITAFSEAGYDVQWQLLNAKHFGVPQNRERIFIVGTRKGCFRKVFPIEGQSNENTTIEKSAETAVARTLTGGGHTGGNHSGMTILQINPPKHSNDRVYSPEGISPTLNTMQGGNRQPFVEEKTRIRRLTEIECERLMGLPDSWTEGVSSSQRYKMIGNGIVVPVVESIIRRII